MARCPKCGKEIAIPFKKWPLPSRKTKEEGEEPKFVGMFDCSSCKTRFRSILKPNNRIEETANIKNMVERIRGIKGELMQTLRNLRDRIKTLETERSNLMIEIDKLRKVAESRATALESEVTMLREEVKSLRDLLGYGLEQEQ